MANQFDPFQVHVRLRVKAAIIAAAREIVAERGVEALTRSRVAERAGLSQAEVSRQFRSKEALIRALASSETS